MATEDIRGTVSLLSDAVAFAAVSMCAGIAPCGGLRFENTNAL